MLTIKATYRGQTRKSTFQGASLFPQYEELSAQIRRLFHIPLGFYLSRLLFAPDSSSPGHTLVSREVRSAQEYYQSIRPFTRKYRNPLLRFTILDLGTAPSPFDNSVMSSAEDSMSVDASGFIPASVRQSISADMDIDRCITPNAGHQSCPQFPTQHDSSTASCCSASESKAEIKTMLMDLQAGLNRVLSSNLSEPLVISPSASTQNAHGATPQNAADLSSCSFCKGTNGSPGNDSVRYSCSDCSAIVCQKCHEMGISGYCFGAMAPHNLGLRGGGNSTNARPSHRSAAPPQPVVHTGVVCDVCNNTIRGVRHKCLDCRDYDLCSSCVSAGGSERHNPFHAFYEILEPGRVVVHTVFDGDVPNGTTKGRNPVVHSATCDLCDSTIEGERYKCLDCPDFDTCASCFSITDVQHPAHSFVKISRTEDYIKRQSASPMHYASCDACRKVIHGARFKCLHSDCPDYDLCHDCEALPIAVHPPNHPMLKMKTPNTVIPTVYRVGQYCLIPETSNKACAAPTAGLRDGHEASTAASLNPPPRVWTPVDRVTTPTPASPKRETTNSDTASSATGASFPIDRQLEDNTNQMFSNPFADAYAILGAAATEAIYHWPTTNKADLFQAVEAMVNTEDLNASLDKPRNDEVGAKAVEKEPPTAAVMSEKCSLLDSLASTQSISSHGVGADTSAPAVPLVVGYLESAAQGIVASISEVTQSLPHSDDVPNKESGTSEESRDFLSIRQSLADLILELPNLVPPPISPTKKEAEGSPARLPLSAAYVEDVTVPDGQVFPPGAEFVKCWRLLNDSGREWPESTELVFLAGDSLSVSGTVNAGSTPSTEMVVHVGETAAGQTVDVWTGELKAPETPGRYVGYWRLRADGELFGNSLWIEINVAEADSRSVADESMASSVIIMPAAADSTARSQHVSSVTVTTHSVATSVDDNVSEAGSDLSLISMPSSPSDDEVWHETRSRPSATLSPTNASSVIPAQAPPSSMDYVLLYGDNSSDSD